MRRSYFYAAAFALLILYYVPTIISARHIGRSISRDRGHQEGPTARPNTKDHGNKMGVNGSLNREGGRAITKRTRGRPGTLQVAGSRLPDCSRACGSCSPCRLVMFSFVCSSLEEAESCPMAYKCMCHNKSYPVP